MNHPELILRTLDRHLAEPSRLILYGRAALALGYPDPPEEFQTTLDVDCILPEIEMDAVEADDSFWNAIHLTNEELRGDGLYITHLFTDSQVILRPTWLDHLVPITRPANLARLRIFRPATLDLILTKMMRVDPQDRADVRFLLDQLQPTREELRSAIEAARLPGVPEIREAFVENSLWLMAP